MVRKGKVRRFEPSEEFVARAGGRFAMTLLRPKAIRDLIRAKGAYWESAREQSGCDLRDAAERTAVDLEALIALETGHLDPADCPGDFLPQLAQAYGNAALVDKYETIFGTDSAEAEPGVLRIQLQPPRRGVS